ncbi:hypothetical protein ACJX0J_027503, partial [Zea mays]
VVVGSDIANKRKLHRYLKKITISAQHTTTYYWQLIPLQLMQQDDEDRKNEINIKLSEIAKILWDKCFGFATQCIVWLMAIFNSIGAKSEEVTLYAEDIPGALECVEKEPDAIISLPLFFYFMFFLTIFLITLAFKTSAAPFVNICINTFGNSLIVIDCEHIIHHTWRAKC